MVGSTGRHGLRILVVTVLVALSTVVLGEPVAHASTGGGATARAVIVTLPDGQVITLPAANLGIREDGTALSLFSPRSDVAGVASLRVVTAGGETVALTFRYTAGGLPATGSDATSLLAAGVVLLVLGGAFVGASRRRATRAARS